MEIYFYKQKTGKTKHFNLHEVSFVLESGYIMGLAGKNGAVSSAPVDPKGLFLQEVRYN